MAATVLVRRYTGTSGAPVLNDVTSVNTRYNTSDTHAAAGTATPIPIPSTGTSYSYWVAYRLDATVTPTGTISNVRWYSDGVNSSPAGVTWKAQEATCVSVDTLVLRADLTYVRAGDLQVGDRIVGFDEQFASAWSGEDSKLRTATVTHASTAVKDCYEIETPQGAVIATGDHPWVARRIDGTRFGRKGKRGWVHTADLDPSQHYLVSLGEPWEEERTYEAGWLSGMWDGEGNLSFPRDNRGRDLGAVHMSLAQNPGVALEGVRDLLKERGFETVERGGTNRCRHLWVKGGMSEYMRLLGTIRPKRLLAHPQMSSLWEGRAWARQVKSVPIISVRHVGPREIAVLSTSTGTLITEGLLSHNTYVQATGTSGTTGNLLNTTNYATLTGATVDLFTFTAASPKSVAGSLANPSTGAFGSWFVTQVEVASTTATTGALPLETWSAVFDES